MRSLLTAVPGLGCALMMGGMVWLMARGSKQSTPPAHSDEPVARDHEAELADLRSEIADLRAQVRVRDEQQSDPTP